MSEVRLTLFIIGVLVLLGIWLHWRWRDAPEARARRSARRETRASEKMPGAAGTHQPRPSRQAPSLDDVSDIPEPDEPGTRREPSLEEIPEPSTDSPLREPSLDEAMLDEFDSGDEDLPVLENVAAAGELPSGAREPEIDEADAGEQTEQDDAREEYILILHVMAGGGEFINGRDIDRVLEGLGLEFSEHGIYHYETEPPGGAEPVRVFSVANMLEPGTFDGSRLDDIRTPGLALFAVLPSSCPGPVVFEEMLSLAHEMARQLSGEVLDNKRKPLGTETMAEIESRVRDL